MRVVGEGKILIPIMELILQIGNMLKREEVDMKCKGVVGTLFANEGRSDMW